MSLSTTQAEKITAVILAGGQGRRMGNRDKGLIKLNNIPLIEHVIDKIAPQVGRIAINSSDSEAYEEYGYPVFADLLRGGLGPLAGLHSALSHCDSELVLILPCDTPLLPADLVERMLRALEESGAELCSVSDGERLHAVFILARRSVKERLEHYLQQGNRRVQEWLRSEQAAVAKFPDSPDSFINLNTPEELSGLEQKQ
jgi:molybdopterin-guanine dinucleotide biosynthesis protein A